MRVVPFTNLTSISGPVPCSTSLDHPGLPFTETIDNVLPVLTNFFCNPGGRIYLTFDKAMSQASIQNLANYTVGAGVTLVQGSLLAPNVVALDFTTASASIGSTLAFDVQDATYTGNHCIANGLVFTAMHGVTGPA